MALSPYSTFSGILTVEISVSQQPCGIRAVSHAHRVEPPVTVVKPVLGNNLRVLAFPAFGPCIVATQPCFTVGAPKAHAGLCGAKNTVASSDGIEQEMFALLIFPHVRAALPEADL